MVTPTNTDNPAKKKCQKTNKPKTTTGTRQRYFVNYVQILDQQDKRHIKSHLIENKYFRERKK